MSSDATARAETCGNCLVDFKSWRMCIEVDVDILQMDRFAHTNTRTRQQSENRFVGMRAQRPCRFEGMPTPRRSTTCFLGEEIRYPPGRLLQQSGLGNFCVGKLARTCVRNPRAALSGKATLDAPL
jgi:hypothetical protein